MGNYKDLKVWQRSKNLAVYMYNATKQNPFIHDHSLQDQIRRSAISIPSNIAEGDELGTDKQSVRFFYIARGSIAEVMTQATIAYEIGYLPEENFSYIQKECNEIGKMLNKLIQSRKE
jgi:four helix bundle protein